MRQYITAPPRPRGIDEALSLLETISKVDEYKKLLAELKEYCDKAEAQWQVQKDLDQRDQIIYKAEQDGERIRNEAKTGLKALDKLKADHQKAATSVLKRRQDVEKREGRIRGLEDAVAERNVALDNREKALAVAEREVANHSKALDEVSSNLEAYRAELDARKEKLKQAIL